jgi:hypothetical protein
MRREGLSWICTAMLFFTSSFVACTSNRYNVRVENLAENRDLYEIEMDIHVLDEETLIERYGEGDNPFLLPPSLLGSDVLVFELLVRNNTSALDAEHGSIVLVLDRMRLLHDGKASSPMNGFQLADFWQKRLGKSAYDHGFEKGKSANKMEYVINREILARKTIVEKEGRSSGILLFTGRFPGYGEGELHIPVFTSQGQVIGVFKEAIQF